MTQIESIEAVAREQNSRADALNIRPDQLQRRTLLHIIDDLRRDLALSECRWGDEKERAERLDEAARDLMSCCLDFNVDGTRRIWLKDPVEAFRAPFDNMHALLFPVEDDNPDGEVPGA